MRGVDKEHDEVVTIVIAQFPGNTYKERAGEMKDGTHAAHRIIACFLTRTPGALLPIVVKHIPVVRRTKKKIVQINTDKL